MILNEIDPKLLELASIGEEELKPIFDQIDETCLYNSNRILSAFI